MCCNSTVPGTSKADAGLMACKGTDHSESLICQVRLVLHTEGGQLPQIKQTLQQLPTVQLPDACQMQAIIFLT